MNRFNNIIYPNLIINAQYQQMRVTMPISVDRTLVRIHCFRLKGAPDEIFHRAVRFITTLGSPASMIFSDDVEMLERCQQGLARIAGPVGRFLARARQRPRDQTAASPGAASEMPMRVQFQAWLEAHDGGGGLMLAYETLREIELFVLEEARLLDEGEFEAWLDLYAPDGIYWMPSKPGQTDPLGVASIIYEDHAILSIRVHRLLEARALVLTPMPRTVHLVSNIEVLHGDERRFRGRRRLHLCRIPGRAAANLRGPAIPSYCAA